MAIRRNRGLIIALVGVALLLAVTLWAYSTPDALGPQVSPSVFSASRAQAILKELVGDDVPHPIGSPANQKVRDLIVRRLNALGYATELQTGLACSDLGACGVPTNIIATLGGDPPGKDAVLLAAHYDSVPAGPGASDDGVGVASLLEIARILTVLPARRHPIVLLVTDGEEAGLLGASLFTREHRLAGHVWAAVNMEARGVSGQSLMFETGTANSWLMHLFAAATLRPISNSLSYVVYKMLPNNTDFTVFKNASYQGFNFAFIGDVAHYHTPLDSFAHASLTTIQHLGDSALGALLALADSTELHPPAGDSVFFDVLARGVVILPLGLVLPAVVAAWIILLAETVFLFRRGLLTGGQAAYGAIGVIVAVIVAGALAVGTLALLRVLAPVPPAIAPTWIAHPLPMHVGFAALALLGAGASATWFARRAGYWGFWFGAWLLIAALATMSAALAPGVSYSLLIAVLTAAAAPLPCLWLLNRKRGAAVDRAAEFAVLAPGLMLFAVTLPMLLFLYPALGAPAWPICTVALSVTACFLLPLLAVATRGVRLLLVLIGAAATFASISITLLLATYSPQWPQRINVEYWKDADSGKAHWWLQAASLRLPHAITDAVQDVAFDPVPRARFAGRPAAGFAADAPAVELAPPELTQIPAPQATPHVELLLRSVRGAAAVYAVFPAGAKVQSVTVTTPAGPLRIKLRQLSGGDTALIVAGIPSSGLQFGIDAASSLHLVQVFDQSPGLPAEVPQGKSLQQARPQNATSSQDGDVTVVQHIARFDPAAGR